MVEVAFDDGVIESGEHREPVSEVELELKSGDLRALYDLGLSCWNSRRSGSAPGASPIGATVLPSA